MSCTIRALLQVKIINSIRKNEGYRLQDLLTLRRKWTFPVGSAVCRHTTVNEGGVVKTDSFNSTKHEACNCSLSLSFTFPHVRSNLRFNLFFIYEFIGELGKWINITLFFNSVQLAIISSFSLSLAAFAKVSKYIIVRDEKHACKLHVYKP